MLQHYCNSFRQQNTREVVPTEETPQASINGDRNNGLLINNAFSMTVETTPGVQPSEREKYGPNGAVQTHGTSRDRVGSEILSEPTPASDLLNAALEPAFPTTQTVSASPDIPENQWTSDAAVSGGKSSKSETDDSRDSVSGRDSSAVFRQIGAAAERTSSPSETATPALDRPGGFADLRPSPSSDKSAEKPPSDDSASTSATLFGGQSVMPIGGADVESLASDLAEPQDQAAERPTADTVLGMQLGAEHAGGPANAIGELADPTDAQPTPVARQLAPSLVSHAELSTKDNETQFEMRLEPPELGRVTVHLRQSDTGLKAHLVVGREATVPILERELPALQAILEDAGVTVENFDVSHDHGDGFQDDRDVRYPFDDDDFKTRSVRAVARLSAGTDWIGVRQGGPAGVNAMIQNSVFP